MTRKPGHRLSGLPCFSLPGRVGRPSHTVWILREGPHNMLEFIRNITTRRNQDGASAVEYGLLVAGIAALIVTVVFVFGGVIKNSFSSTCGKISGSGSGTSTC